MFRSRTITDWDPEDIVAWEAGNKNVARRNLLWSVIAEHIGLSIWTMWSVMVLFMPFAASGRHFASRAGLLGRFLDDLRQARGARAHVVAIRMNEV